METIADLDIKQLGGRLSILWRQKQDHVRLDRLLNDLESTFDPVARARTLQQLARLVFPHAFAEEAVLWPVVRRVVPDGEDLTAEVEMEHQEVNELWRQLETQHRSGDFDADALERQSRLAAVLRDDVRDEEDRILPQLHDALGVARLRLLGVVWEAVRRTAPTRPHPVVSRRPPGNALAALPLTVLDRSRDALDEVGRRSARMSGPCRWVSDRLGDAAARVEEFGVLRRGERSETSREPDRRFYSSGVGTPARSAF